MDESEVVGERVAVAGEEVVVEAAAAVEVAEVAVVSRFDSSIFVR